MDKTSKSWLPSSLSSLSSLSFKNLKLQQQQCKTSVLIGTAVLGIIGGIVYYLYKPTKHDIYPNLDVPHSWLTGHINFFIEENEKNRFHETLYDAFLHTKSKFNNNSHIINLSFPERHCRLFTTDIDIIKFVFEDKFESFEKGDTVRDWMREILGEGIFVIDPPKWKIHRKAASKMFSMRNLSEYMFSCAVSSSQRTIAKLEELNNTMKEASTKGIDIYEVLGRFTLDSFIEICFGKSLNIIETMPEEHAFTRAFDESIHICSMRSYDPIWKLKRELGIGLERNIRANEKILNDFVYKLLDIESRRRIIDESGVNKHDLISLYLSLEPNITRQELRDIALNMIIAGRDTTRLLLSWFFYAVENKPKILAKIKEEIRSMDQSDISYSQASEEMRYTECVLLETLRLYPVVGYLWRYAREDVTYPEKNFTIRKGESLSIHQWSMGRSREIWGEDVFIFDPMRWYEKGLKTKTPYEFVQFHIPPRMCLGRQFALLEAKTFLFYFFKKFDFKAVKPREISYDHNENQKVTIPYASGALLQMMEGYYLTLSNI